jgi:hypothetical protein
VKASNAGADDFFGIALALSGDGNTLAVGATGEAASGNNAPSSGAAYVYTRSAGSWSQQSYIKASNSESFDEFGFSVALSGDGNTLAVGAHLEDGSGTGIDGASTNSATESGAAYVYSRNGSTWSQRAYVKASNTGSTDRFGNSVALNGDGNTLAVGALMEDGGGTGIGTTPNDTDVNTAAEAGAVYLY